jgi:hypothetical protein
MNLKRLPFLLAHFFIRNINEIFDAWGVPASPQEGIIIPSCIADSFFHYIFLRY